LADPLTSLRDSLADRYAVERELGRGGMATVYLATDRKHQRPVAIKVLGPDLVATLGAERFLREIQTAARLQHPSILALHDYGLAVIEAALGNVNGAIAELELARDERAWAMFAIKHDPAFDPLRSDPRFNRLLRELNLIPARAQ